MALRQTSVKSRARNSFVYKPRTADQIKSRATRQGGKFDSIFKSGFDTFRCKVGDNLIRYLPPTWDDHEHYGYTIWVHQRIGPDDSTYLCPRKMLNKACPVCEAAKESKAAHEDEEAKALEPKERVVSWILDRDADDPEKPLLYDISWTMDRDIVSLCVNDRTGEILMIDNPNKGYDVTIKRYGTGPHTKYSGFAIARDDSPIHEDEKIQDEILDYIMSNPIPSVLNFYDYDYLERVISGTLPAKDEDLDKGEVVEEEVVEETAPRRVSRPSRREVEEEVIEERPARQVARRPVRQETVEEELDEQYDEETGELPAHDARGRSAAKPAARRQEPVDEEVDEEAEVLEERRPARQPVRAISTGRSRVPQEEVDEEDLPPERPSSRRSDAIDRGARVRR